MSLIKNAWQFPRKESSVPCQKRQIPCQKEKEMNPQWQSTLSSRILTWKKKKWQTKKFGGWCLFLSHFLFSFWKLLFWQPTATEPDLKFTLLMAKHILLQQPTAAPSYNSAVTNCCQAISQVINWVKAHTESCKTALLTIASVFTPIPTILKNTKITFDSSFSSFLFHFSSTPEKHAMQREKKFK